MKSLTAENSDVSQRTLRRELINSKPEDRAESDSQIVMRSTVEINLVTGFEAQAEWADCGRNTGAGIQSGVQIRSAQSEDGACDVAIRQQAGTETEICESGFQSRVRVEMAGGALQPGTDESLGNSDGSLLDRLDISVDKVAVGFIEVETVVIGELAFEPDPGIDTVAKASAQPEIVRAALRNAQIVEEDASFNTIPRRALFYALLGESRRKEKDD